MIRSRRRRHLFASLTLAVVLPLMFLLGLLLRPQYPAVDDSAKILFQKDGYVSLPETQLGKRLSAQVLTTDATNLNAETFVQPDGKVVLALKPKKDLQQPDLLVYWDDSKEPPTEVNDDARYLGRLSGPSQRQFTIPEEKVGKSGFLVVYSQGKQSMEAVLPVKSSLTQPSSQPTSP